MSIVEPTPVARPNPDKAYPVPLVNLFDILDAFSKEVALSKIYLASFNPSNNSLLNKFSGLFSDNFINSSTNCFDSFGVKVFLSLAKSSTTFADVFGNPSIALNASLALSNFFKA